MRLLLIFPFIPYPPTDGGRIGFFNPIKYLSRNHELVVVSLAGAGEEAAAEELGRLCPNLHVFKRPTGGDLLRLVRGLGSPLPGSSAKYWYPAAGELIREVIAARNPEVVEFHHLNTAIYRGFAQERPVVLREHNVQFKIWERHAENTEHWAERIYSKWCAPRLRKFEAESAARFDRCVVVSKADAAHLQAVAPQARIEVIPSGVDTEYFYPSTEIPEESYRMVLTGSFEWKPKHHNLRVLLADIMPRIRAKAPEAELYVVGSVPDELRRLGERTPGVTMTGKVPDVRPYVWRSSLVLNYLESGGGIALKLLEAMAMRKAILSNTLGCEGIEVEHGRNVFLADGTERFAEAAAYLVEDAATRRSLAENGYKRAHELYSWAVIANQFQRLYENVVEERSGAKGALGSAARAPELVAERGRRHV